MVMKMFGKKENPLVKFVTTIEGLDQIDECLPKPSNKFIPQWWKDVPYPKNDPIGNVKICPSFTDYFSQGFIVPMWTDTLLRLDKENNRWGFSTRLEHFSWEFHPESQALDYVDMSVRDNVVSGVFKANCPWQIITPKGYSVLQIPLFYHFNQDFSVMPGIIDTDIHHQINQQVLFHSDKEEIFIPRGTPFVQYIPFERKKYNGFVGLANDEDKKKMNKDSLNMLSKFLGSGQYRKDQIKNK